MIHFFIFVSLKTKKNVRFEKFIGLFFLGFDMVFQGLAVSGFLFFFNRRDVGETPCDKRPHPAIFIAAGYCSQLP